MAESLLTALLLAVIQGITEWLPISSSGHLVLFERLFSYAGGLLFEVALHFGTLAAVFVYFGKDIVDMIRDFFSGKFKSSNGRMAIYLIIGTIPAVIVGFFARDIFDSILSDLRIVALGFGITGVFLLISSFANIKEGKLDFRKSLFVGFAQALAIVPGISRSGSTIASGVLLGLNEKDAMRFSFLLSIPIIFGANLLTIGNNTLSPDLIWASLVSFVVGLITIHLMFNYLLVKREYFKWFGIYCILLGLVVFGFVLVF